MSRKGNQTQEGEPLEKLGSGVSDAVMDQLIAREKLISTQIKDRDQLLFFNGNGAWARLVSSVNTITEEDALGLAVGSKNINAVVGSNTLADQNVLMGGFLKQGTPKNVTELKGGVNQNLHNPINVDLDGYITAGDINNSAYNKYESLGFRPTPGIESVSVKSKGSYGVVREAEVSIKVWTLEDLEVMQALYLRPGYSILLEWGHALQLDSESIKINKDIQLYRKFLQKNKLPASTIEKDLQEIRQDSDYNYDTVYGYITNFSWSFNSDGGYDCTVKIISKGSIIESIALTFDTSDTYPADQLTDYKEDVGKKERRSIFHKFFVELDKAGETVGDVALTDSGYAGGSGDRGLTATKARTFQNVADASPETLTGLALQADPTYGPIFNAKLEKLKRAGKIRYNAPGNVIREVEWTDFDGSDNFAGLEQEPAATYLNQEFQEFGLVFESSGNTVDDEVIAYQKGNEDNKTVFEFDSLSDYQDRIELNTLIAYLKNYARIPTTLSESNTQTVPESSNDSANTATPVSGSNTNIVDVNNPDDINEQSNQIQNTKKLTYFDRLPIITKKNLAKTAQDFKDNLSRFVAFKLKELEAVDENTYFGDALIEYWVPLGVILDIYNNYVTTFDGTQEPTKGTKTKGRKLTQFYTGAQDENPIAPRYERRAKYLTNEYHFSIDPMKCILPKVPKNITLYDSKGEPINWAKSVTDYAAGQVWKNGFHANVQEAFNTTLLRGEPDDILNILVSCQFIKDELDKILEQSKDSDQNENNNMVSFLETILAGLNDAMGGINDLSIFYDEEEDLFYIVDRKSTPAEINFLPKISLTGLRSTVSNLTIQSKISSNIGSMVSIAAQGTGGNTKDNIGPLLQWNRGLLDRHIIHKSERNDETGNQTETKEDTKDKKLKKWARDYKDFWDEFNSTSDLLNTSDYSIPAVQNLKEFHKEYTKTYVVEAKSKNKENPIPPPGVIPIELSFTMMGIGGFKIGQAFLIEEGVVPRQYADYFGFLITGLDHKIADGKWTTDVKTTFFSTRKPTKEEIEDFIEKNKIENKPFEIKDTENTSAETSDNSASRPGSPGNITGETVTSGFPFSGDFINKEVNKTQVLLHWTAGNQLADQGRNTIDILNQNGLSYHYIIDAAGHVEQLVPENVIAYHAGCGPGGCGSTKISANTNSIGISLMNLGHCRNADNSSYGPVPEGQLKCVRLVDHNGNPFKYRGYEWNQEVTDAQLNALGKLLKEVKQRNPGIPNYSWKGKETFDIFFPPDNSSGNRTFSYQVNKPGYYTHNSSNKTKSDIMPTPKVVNFLKTLVI